METLYRILNYIVTGRTGFVFEILVCEILFSLSHRPRKLPLVTVPVAVAIHLLFGLLIPTIRAGSFTATVTTLCIFAVSVLLQWGLLDISFHRVMFNSAAAYAVQSLALNAREVITILAGLSGWASLAVAYLADAAVFAASYFLFARKGKNEEMRIGYAHLYFISLLTVLITNVLFSLLIATVGQRWETKMVLCICCLLVLMLQYSAFTKGIASHERDVLERLLRMEQKQHELSQKSIDLINIKAHDLKSQIALLKQTLGAQAESIVSGAEEAVRAYDSFVDTGNKDLDLVINEEKLYCDRCGIALETMADGSILGFVEPSDVYSLMGNALRNAVECAEKEEGDKRHIWVDIHHAGGYVCIEVKNLCSQKIEFKDGRPVTSKADRSYHGYGIPSMDLIVKKYGGNMVIGFTDGVFLVKIILPYHLPYHK